MSKSTHCKGYKRALETWSFFFRSRDTLDKEDQQHLMKIMRTVKALSEEDRKFLVARFFNLKPEATTFWGGMYPISELAKRFDMPRHAFDKALTKAILNFSVLWEKDDPMTEYLVKGNLGISCTLREDGSYLVVYENVETGEQLKSEVMEL